MSKDKATPPSITVEQLTYRQRYGTLVTWRGTTASAHKGFMSLSFESKTGEVIRLQMEFSQAKKLQASMCHYLPESTGCQSERSSAMPISDGSIPQEGQKV